MAIPRQKLTKAVVAHVLVQEVNFRSVCARAKDPVRLPASPRASWGKIADAGTQGPAHLAESADGENRAAAAARKVRLNLDIERMPFAV